MVGISDDKSLRIRAARLKGEEEGELYLSLVNAVDEYAIFALDPNGHILTWNAGAQRIKGYTADEIIGSHFSRFYTAPDIERGHPAHELELAAKNGKYEEEGWRVRKDGTTFWANVVITAIRDEAGQLTGYGKVTRDLTARRQADEALRQSQERYRLLVDNIQDYLVIFLDPLGRITSWNAGATQITGYQPGEILGSHVSRFYTSEDIASHKLERELEAASTKGRYEEEGWRVRKDGTRFWANVIMTPVQDDTGHLIGFSKITRDLTERRKAEEAMRDANSSLEHRIEERTKELNDAKLRAESAVRARDDFFSMASHELRTPITALKLQTQLRRRAIAKGDFSDFAHEGLPKLLDNDERMLNRLNGLVDRMLDITRMTTGRIRLTPEDVDLCELTREVAQRMRAVLELSGNTLELHADCDIQGHWDRVRLDQILTNLLTNAGKYAPACAVVVSVEKVGETAVLKVKDHGRGIAPEDQKRIFEPFERLKEREDVGGLGLGLYISYRLAEAHGGKLRVESAVGKGTTFILELPLAGAKAN